MTVNIQHLTKRIGKQIVLNDISLSIQEGEIVALLGENGAGKSSLMKCLTGLWAFDKGELEVCGVNMRENPHAVAPYVGYLPELNPLYEEMYVLEYLEFMYEMTNDIRHKIKDIGHHSTGVSRPMSYVLNLMSLVGLTPEAHKKIGQLSKGYKQRVGLAQALMGNPKLLILDEPTTGLDPNQLKDIRALIRELGQGRTIILSTHIMQEVKAMCDRVLILSHGHLKADITDFQDINLEELFSVFSL